MVKRPSPKSTDLRVFCCRVKQFETNELLRAARDEEEGDSDDDAETQEFRRLEAGAYTQQRLAVVMVVVAAHSSAVARRVDGKLHQVRMLFGGVHVDGWPWSGSVGQEPCEKNARLHAFMLLQFAFARCPCCFIFKDCGLQSVLK